MISNELYWKMNNTYNLEYLEYTQLVEELVFISWFDQRFWRWDSKTHVCMNFRADVIGIHTAGFNFNIDYSVFGQVNSGLDISDLMASNCLFECSG